jgi:hypothetical protein
MLLLCFPMRFTVARPVSVLNLPDALHHKYTFDVENEGLAASEECWAGLHISRPSKWLRTKTSRKEKGYPQGQNQGPRFRQKRGVSDSACSCNQCLVGHDSPSSVQHALPRNAPPPRKQEALIKALLRKMTAQITIMKKARGTIPAMTTTTMGPTLTLLHTWLSIDYTATC